jgi:FG-GAP repeat
MHPTTTRRDATFPPSARTVIALLGLTLSFSASAQHLGADRSRVDSSSSRVPWNGDMLAQVWQNSPESRPGNLQNLPAHGPESSNVNFLPAVTYSTGDHNPDAATIADVNGDGKPDLIVGNHANGEGLWPYS